MIQSSLLKKIFFSEERPKPKRKLKMSKLIFLLIICIFLRTVFTIICEKAVSTYFFESETIGYGKKESDGILTSGSISIYCNHTRVTKKGLYSSFIAYIPEVIVEQKTKGLNVRPNSPKLQQKFQKILASFTKDANGVVQDVYLQKKDSPYVQGVIKTVIGLFSVNVKQGISKERVSQGLSNVLYVKKPFGVLEKTYSYENLIATAIRGQKKRDIKFKVKNVINMKDGRIVRVVSTEESRIGMNNAQRKEYSIQKGHMYHKTTHANTLHSKRAEVITDTETVTILELKDVSKLKKIHQHETKSAKNTLSFEKQTLYIHESLVNSTMDIHKEKLKIEMDFVKSLKKFREHPNKKRFTKLVHYTKLFKNEVSGILIHAYRGLNLKNPKDKKFSEALHNLIGITQTEEGQKVLAEAMRNPETTGSAILSTVLMEKPSLEVIDTLAEIYSQFKDDDEDELRLLSNNAYLLMAGTASKVEDHHAHQILRAISMNMENSQDSNEWVLHLRALKNAGDATPLEIYKTILDHKDMPTEIKVLATKALSGRTSQKTKLETTKFIHDILDSDHHELVKVAAIQSQTEREKEIQESSSILEFAKHLENEETTEQMTLAIHDYYKLLDMNVNELLDDIKQARKHDLDINAVLTARTFNSCRGFGLFGGLFSGACRTVHYVAIPKIVEYAQIVVDGVVSVATTIGKKIVEIAKKAYEHTIKKLIDRSTDLFSQIKEMFQKYEIDESKKKCVAANVNANWQTKSELICIFDDALFNYVQQIDTVYRLRDIPKSNHFVDERLWGSRAIHFYTGIVAYYGADISLNQCTTQQKFKVAMFAKSKQAISFFGEQFIVAGLEGNLLVASDTPLRNNFVLTILGIDVINYHLFPNKVISECQKFNIILFDTTSQVFYQYTRVFVASFIPFTLEVHIGGGIRMDTNVVLCPKFAQYTLEIYPSVSFFIKVSGSIGIPMIQAGLSGEFSLGVGASFMVGRHVCRECFRAFIYVEPFKFIMKVFAKFLFLDWSEDIFSVDITDKVRIPLPVVCKNPNLQPQAMALLNHFYQKGIEHFGELDDPEETTIGPLFSTGGGRTPRTSVKYTNTPRTPKVKNPLKESTMNFIKGIFDHSPMILKAGLFSQARKFIERDLLQYLGKKIDQQLEDNSMMKNLIGKPDFFNFIPICSVQVPPSNFPQKSYVYPESTVVSPGNQGGLTYTFMIKVDQYPKSDRVIVFTRGSQFTFYLEKDGKFSVDLPILAPQNAPPSNPRPNGNQMVNQQVDYSLVQSQIRNVKLPQVTTLNQWNYIALSIHKSTFRAYFNMAIHRADLHGEVDHDGPLFIPPKLEDNQEKFFGSICGFSMFNRDLTAQEIDSLLTEYQRTLYRKIDTISKRISETLLKAQLPSTLTLREIFPNSINEFIRNSHEFDKLNTFSYAFRIKPKDKVNQMILRKGEMVEIHLTDKTEILVRIRTSGGVNELRTQELPLHVYSHITFVYFGRTIAIYLDGSFLIDAIFSGEAMVTTSPISLIPSFNSFEIYGLTVYGYVLNPEEVNNIAWGPIEKTLFSNPVKMTKTLQFPGQEIPFVGLKGSYSYSFLASFDGSNDQTEFAVRHGFTNIRFLSNNPQPPSTQFVRPGFSMGAAGQYHIARKVCTDAEFYCEPRNECYAKSIQLINGDWKDGCPFYPDPDDDPNNTYCKDRFCLQVATNHIPATFNSGVQISVYPKWTFVVVSFIGHEASIYFDGTLIGTKSFKNNIIWDLNNQLTFSKFPGYIAEAKVFNVPLSKNEIEIMSKRYLNYINPMVRTDNCIQYVASQFDSQGRPLPSIDVTHEMSVLSINKEREHENTLGVAKNRNYCFGTIGSSSSVCSGQGKCVARDRCDCNTGFTGSKCETSAPAPPLDIITIQVHVCYGKSQFDPNVCSKNGNCVDNNKCHCKTGFTGLQCETNTIGMVIHLIATHTCFGIQNQDPTVCNGRGKCVGQNICQCNTKFSGASCNIEEFTCNGVSSLNSNVCSGRGRCTANNRCECNPGFGGNNCELFKCFDILQNDPSVCNRNGRCTSLNRCECNPRFSGSNCHVEEFRCNGIASSQPNVCSGRGRCIGNDRCECNNGYGGSHCQNLMCFGVLSTNGNVCGGQGLCIGPNQCQCNPNSGGHDCSIALLRVITLPPPPPPLSIITCGRWGQPGEFRTIIQNQPKVMNVDSNQSPVRRFTIETPPPERRPVTGLPFANQFRNQ